MRALLVPLVLLGAALAGCDAPETLIDDGHPGSAAGPAPFLILHATYVLDDGASGEFYGHHCADASVHDGTVRLHDALKDDLGDGPTLVVEPGIEGMWATLGDGGYPLRLPAEVRSEAGGDDGVWTTIGWSDGGVHVDGEPVGLPRAWTVERDGYSIEATLSFGPDDHEWFARDNCI